MTDIKIRQGYDLNLVGKPASTLVDAKFPQHVGWRPPEFYGIKWRPVVEEGETVSAGTPLLTDKNRPELALVAPVSGKVAGVNRGARRALMEVVVETDGADNALEFDKLDLYAADRETITNHLLKSGLWPLFRQHPYSKIATPGDGPKAIFVTAVADHPYGADPVVLLEGLEENFQRGIDALAKLTDGKVHVTVDGDADAIPAAIANGKGFEQHQIFGPHPKSSATAQAFYIDRNKPGEKVWYLNAADVAAIGSVCVNGRFPSERRIALAGNGVKEDARQHYRTVFGASLADITEGLLDESLEQRLISGSVLNGDHVEGTGGLGLYDVLVSVIPEGRQKYFIGWMDPGIDKHSYTRAYMSALAGPDQEFEMTTNIHGGHRACIQSGHCLEVCPTDVLPLPVWKAISYGDLEEADALGIKDCVECGLCTYVCPSKIDIDGIITQGLHAMEKEGF